jgi:choline dehydrogenase-like flavoprotein
MEMNCAERHVRDAMERAWGRERKLTIGRCAVLTRDHHGRKACHYCGPCQRGCITRSYFSSVNSTLPRARATGRLTFRPHSVVSELLFDPRKGMVRGVRVIDAQTRQGLEIQARVIFLCASALESARILLNSKSAQFPEGLGSSSGQLGRNLMDHIFLAGATGTIPGHERETSFGRRPNGIYVPRFRNVRDRHPAFLRGYGMQGSARRANWERGATMDGFGTEYKNRLLREQGPWTMWLGGWGECLPREDNVVSLDPGVKDIWGIPALRIHCTWGPNELAMVNDMQVAAAEILEAAGARDIEAFDDKATPGLCIHEMGTARMGRDPGTSVLNRWNQLWEAPNVFVTDGACMTSSGCQNPSMTYMALTARACAYAVEAMKRREL